MIKDEILKLPDLPGCYLFFNKSNQIIYIGKAKNIKKRVKSYFTGSHNTKTTKLILGIERIEYIVTTNERESLILENKLIKKHNPRFNIMLKDDKTYPYIVITNEKHPRVLKSRDRKIKGKYYGPYPSNTFVNKTIEIINRYSKLRKCRVLPKNDCIYNHLSQCYAPCINEISKEEVNNYKNEVDNLIKNNFSEMKKIIKKEMKDKAEKLDFEKAQYYKEYLELLENNDNRQAVDLDSKVNVDAISFYYDSSWVVICIIEVRSGMIENIKKSIHSHNDDFESVILTYLYNSYYKNKVDLLIEEEKLEKLIADLTMNQLLKSHLIEYRQLEQMAQLNARQYFKDNVEKITKLVYEKEISGFEELKQVAGDDLEIIEMYDISHLGGDAQVGAKVVYKNGKKDKSLYRKYKIMNSKKADEYGSLEEILTRRVEKIISEDDLVPNLILLDGGKGQMSVAKKVLNQYNLLDQIKLLGLIKDGKHKTKSLINKNNQIIELKKGTGIYRFLYEIQEEVHRFAIDYHKKAKSNSLYMSELDNILGLGPKRKKKLIEEFNSTNEIKKCDENDLVSIGIPKNIAKNIVLYFSSND